MNGLVVFVPGSTGLSQVAPNFLTLEVRLHPEQIDSTIKELEAAQNLWSHPPL